MGRQRPSRSCVGSVIGPGIAPRELRAVMEQSFIRVRFQTAPRERVSVCLRESLGEELVVFAWPAAYVLAAYIATSDDFRGRSLLELGAGVALPSLMAGIRGASRILVTDRDEDTTLRLIQSNIDLNSLGSICSVVTCLDVPGSWRSLICRRTYLGTKRRGSWSCWATPTSSSRLTCSIRMKVTAEYNMMIVVRFT